MDKIKAWGMCKNMKRCQRLAVMKGLEAGEAEIGMMGPVRLNEGKLRRWKKEAQNMGAIRDESMKSKVDDSFLQPPDEKEDPHIGQAADVVNPDFDNIEGIEEIIQRKPERSPLAPSHSALDRLNQALQDPGFAQELGVTKTYWDAADIPGSPELSRFFEALRIAAEVPELSLDDDKGPPEGPPEDGCISPEILLVVKKPTGAKRAIRRPAKCEQAIVMTGKRGPSTRPDLQVQSWLLQALQNSVNPFHEIDVFPRVVDLEEEETHGQQPVVPRTPLQQQLLEHKERLQKFKKLKLSPESDAVMEELSKLGKIYYDLGQYHSAELSYHQLATAREKRWGEDDPRTLSSSLNIVRMKINQGYFSQAAVLHQTLHPRILNVANSGSRLARDSIRTGANIDMYCNRMEEMDNGYRQILQICLTKYGLRNIETWTALTNMATRISFKELAGSEHLFRIAQQLKDQVTGMSERRFWRGMTYFPNILAEQGNLEDACTIARVVARNLEQIFGLGTPDTLMAYRELGRALRRQGKLDEAEEVLWRASNESIALFGRRGRDTLKVLFELALTLKLEEKYQEAATLFEDVSRGKTVSQGRNNPITIRARKYLVACYKVIGHDEVLIEQKLVDLLVEYTATIAEKEGLKTAERSEEESARPSKKSRMTEET